MSHQSIVPVTFTSSWEEDDVVTTATLNLTTGTLSDIVQSEEGDQYEHLNREYIEVAGLSLQAQVTLRPDSVYALESEADLQAIRFHCGYEAQPQVSVM